MYHRCMTHPLLLSIIINNTYDPPIRSGSILHARAMAVRLFGSSTLLILAASVFIIGVCQSGEYITTGALTYSRRNGGCRVTAPDLK